MKQSKFIGLSLLYWLPFALTLPGTFTYTSAAAYVVFSDAIFRPFLKLPGMELFLELFLSPVDGTALLIWIIPFWIGVFLLLLNYKRMDVRSRTLYWIFGLVPAVLVAVSPILFSGLYTEPPFVELPVVAGIFLGLFPVFQISYLVNYIKWYKKEKSNLT